MSTMAILNSARKAMEQAKRVSMSARDIEQRPGAATPRRNRYQCVNIPQYSQESFD